MKLHLLVETELEILRAMKFSDLRSLAEESHKEIKSSWWYRQSVSVYVEPVDGDALRVIAKAFESRFPHMVSMAFADGFRVQSDGKFSPLSESDRRTLY